jgi:alpha-L-rhamnosidase
MIGPTVDAYGAVDHAPGPPTLLTVDDDAAPIAVEGAPQFGWVVNDPDRGEAQTAYELVVSALPSGVGAAPVIWRSGEVRSSQQAYVAAPGMLLQADHSYAWTVRTWDRAGRPGPFSKPARFDVGVGDGDWHALWIRRPAAEQAPFEDFSLLRKELAVTASPIVRARAYMSAGQQYDLRVNGVRVAHGPSFAYPDEQYYQATDIAAALRAGSANAIAVITHWSTPGQGRPASVPGFIARITVDHADGTRQVITSDTSWRTFAGPWIQGNPRNTEGDFIEHVDGRLDPVGWDQPGFDDQTWVQAATLGAHPVAPFLHLYAARSAIIEQRVSPVTLTRLATGAYVADFGSVIAATPAIKLPNGVAGRAVSVRGGYLLDPNGAVSTTQGTQQTDMHWYYDERAGSQEFRPFGYLGYRYLEVFGAGETLTPDDVVSFARHASMPDENAASFKTSNPAVDAVWNLARHSALYATQEQFIDTPTREKGAFMDPFDSSVTMAAFDDRAMTFEALRDFARSQQRYWPDGRVNVVYPNGDGKRDIPDSTEQYVEWVWHVYQTTGDLDQLASLYPVVKNISDYIDRAIDPKTGLVTNLPGGGSDYLYGLVDWPPQSRYGYDMATAARTTENLLALDDFRDVADLARALGRPIAEVNTEVARAERLTNAIESRLRRPDGVLVDGLEANGTQSTHASQLANAYALAFRLTPASDLSTVADYVVSHGNETGVSTFSNLLVALHNAGRDQAFIAAITDPNRPGYAQILKEGATYTWESWDARQSGDSESHGFGSTVLSVLQDDVLGVRTAAPGAAMVDVHTPGLVPMHVAGVDVTQRGRIPISWDRPAPGHFSLDVTIPANVIATVHIPASRVSDVSDGSRTVAHDPGVTAVGTAPGEVVITVGSGHYQFHVPSTRRATHTSWWALTIVIAAILLALGLTARAVAGIRHRGTVGSIGQDG